MFTATEITEKLENAFHHLDTIRGDAVEGHYTSEPDKAALADLTAEINSSLARFYRRGTQFRKTLDEIRKNFDDASALLFSFNEAAFLEESVKPAAYPVLDQIADELKAVMERGFRKMKALEAKED